ncbi:Alpha/Beta hydrolase protein [Chytriomyces sp. MP71]|nr:Alpha/Beta hydrolase protein [Chytriomyces sp. MP71]
MIDHLTPSPYQTNSLLPLANDWSDSIGSLFFWMFESKSFQKNKKLIFFFNGGPGCSSMDGVFLENGPFIPMQDGSVQLRSVNWLDSATVVFLDQPVGTGYSHTGKKKKNGYATSLEQVAEHFHAFLDRFFEVFRELGTAELYITGESYAGQYIPYMVKKMMTSVPKRNLRGIMIGSGWMDPKRQYLSSVDYAVSNNILGGEYLTEAHNAQEQCRHLYASNPHESIKKFACEEILDVILLNSTHNDHNCINMYDIRYHDATADGGCGMYAWPPHLHEMASYLDRDDVKEALHVTRNIDKPRWVECDTMVSKGLSDTLDVPSYLLLPDILARIPVLLYNGDKDLICNWFGIYDMVNELSWNGNKGMQNATKEAWYLDSQLQGWYQTSRNLTFVLKHNASHMMPVDAPEAARNILNRFIGAEAMEITHERLKHGQLGMSQPSFGELNSSTVDREGIATFLYEDSVSSATGGANLGAVMALLAIGILLMVISLAIVYLHVKRFRGEGW